VRITPNDQVGGNERGGSVLKDGEGDRDDYIVSLPNGRGPTLRRVAQEDKGQRVPFSMWYNANNTSTA
jgi:hypothetical protein